MNSRTTLTFVNHASFLIETGQAVLLMDPWVEGTAFDNGWALLYQGSSNDELVNLVRQKQKPLFLWYSHEHSDHFSVSFLRHLVKSGERPTILYQDTLDHRVTKFCSNLGLDVIECLDGREYDLSQDLSVRVFPYRGGDSFALFRADRRNILNLNDCIVQRESDAVAVAERIGRDTHIDILLTQFGYANWLGNPEHIDLRKTAAEEKISRIKNQASVLKPSLVVPFASYVFFCDSQNMYLNDLQNTPKRILDSQLAQDMLGKIRFMRPYEELDLEFALDEVEEGSRAAALFWDEQYGSLKFLPPDDLVNLHDIRQEFESYRAKMHRIFLFLPSLAEFLRYMRPIVIKVDDLNVNVKLSYLRGLTETQDDRFDLALNSKTLKFVIKNEYGFDTLSVNGKFRTAGSDAMPAQVQRFFAFQQLSKIGLGVNHPLPTIRLIFNVIRGRIRRGLGKLLPGRRDPLSVTGDSRVY
jgi:L-ascorbate metabolism protein UlaG (beta-lactamase superfamily)